MKNFHQLALPITLLAGIFVLGGCGESESQVIDDGTDALLNAGLSDTPFISDGIKTPKLTTPEPNALPDDTRVIGVVFNDTARAYAVRAMSGTSTHVVNDKFGNSPISITYCDQTDCARVLTVLDEEMREEINLQTGGFADREMLLRLDESMYPHSSKDIPLKDCEFQLTTWKEWKTAHSESKLYDMESATNASYSATP